MPRNSHILYRGSLFPGLSLEALYTHTHIYTNTHIYGCKIYKHMNTDIQHLLCCTRWPPNSGEQNVTPHNTPDFHGIPCAVPLTGPCSLGRLSLQCVGLRKHQWHRYRLHSLYKDFRWKIIHLDPFTQLIQPSKNIKLRILRRHDIY